MTDFSHTYLSHSRNFPSKISGKFPERNKQIGAPLSGVRTTIDCISSDVNLGFEKTVQFYVLITYGTCNRLILYRIKLLFVFGNLTLYRKECFSHTICTYHKCP